MIAASSSSLFFCNMNVIYLSRIYIYNMIAIRKESEQQIEMLFFFFLFCIVELFISWKKKKKKLEKGKLFALIGFFLLWIAFNLNDFFLSFYINISFLKMKKKKEMILMRIHHQIWASRRIHCCKIQELVLSLLFFFYC